MYMQLSRVWVITKSSDKFFNSSMSLTPQALNILTIQRINLAVIDPCLIIQIIIVTKVGDCLRGRKTKS